MSTAKGLIYFVFNTAIAKGITFVTQFVLGWLLMPEEYGLYAIVISVGVFVSILANGGMERVLIRRGDEILKLQSTAVAYSFFFNFLAMAIFTILSAYVADLYEDKRLYLMLVIMGFVFPLGTPAALYRVKLSIQRKYKELAILKTISSVVRQIMIVVLALNDYGVYSFVIPMIIEVVVESTVGAYFTKWSPSFGKIDFHLAKELFADSKWIIIANLMLGMATTGDYFLLGLMLTKEQLGLYFFGLQLVVSVLAIFSMAIQGVMLPALMPFVNDVSQFRRVFSGALTKIFFISMPTAVLLALCSDFLIHWIWNGKWDEAIPVSQIMFVSMPFWLMVFLARSGLEALGLWKTRLVYLAIFGITSIGVSVFLAQYFKIVTIAIGVALIRGLVGVFQSLSIFKILDVEYQTIVFQLLTTTIIALGSGLVCKLGLNVSSVDDFDLMSTVFVASIYVFTYIFLVRVFQKNMYLSFLDIVNVRVGKYKSS